MKLAIYILASACCLRGQSFEVASVKPSAHPVGPDYNNQIAIGAASFRATNATLKRLIVDAYAVQSPQVTGGPAWLAQGEYDVEAKFDPAARGHVPAMLQRLLAERFHLTTHRETRELRAWELVVEKGGAKVRQADSDEPAGAIGSRHFRCTLAQLAELISVQLSILPTENADPARPSMAGNPVPVLDRTGLAGIYDFQIELKPEADSLAMWQRILQSLGLKLESRKAPLEMLVVDRVERVPTAN